jgi:hypothetical protein
MDTNTLVAVVLVSLLVVFSLHFDKPYAPALHEAARHPFARFVAGLGIVALSAHDPLLAVLGLVVVFFWIADVNLLSSFSL